MIPLRLIISGFLSYKEPVEIDFTGFDLACIAGPNGAGKSSLLDAITWTLFGQARKRDDSLVNSQSSAAEICLDFLYENNIYRVQRALPRGKTSQLYFFLLKNRPGEAELAPQERLARGEWKPLTEHTIRETQKRIEGVLCLDYETFVNASFFLQGKADLFTQQSPGDRKKILASILGLDVWETYRQRAFDRRKSAENRLSGIDGQLEEIRKELGEEETRKNALASLEAELGALEAARKALESLVDSNRQIQQAIASQRKAVQEAERSLAQKQERLLALEGRVKARREERAGYARLLERAATIRADYASLQAIRAKLAEWDRVAVDFCEQEKLRQAPLDEINQVRAALLEKASLLRSKRGEVERWVAQAPDLQTQLQTRRQELAQAEAHLNRRSQLNEAYQAALEQKAQAEAENPVLYQEMHKLNERIQRLKTAEGAACPVCGGPLSPSDRDKLIAELTVEGTEKGDRHRENTRLLKQFGETVNNLKNELASLGKAEDDARRITGACAQLASQIEAIQQQQAEWQQNGALVLAEVEDQLERESFAQEARLELDKVDAALKAIGYDSAEHDRVRKAEAEGRKAEEALHELEKAEAALAPLERGLADQENDLAAQSQEVSIQQKEYQTLQATLQAQEANAPDFAATDRDLLNARERENQLRGEVGGARQRVAVLSTLKARQAGYEADRLTLARKVERYRRLETAFSNKGVPALLIEQALPEIERHANEILERLSGGNMTVHFPTQKGYKDKSREDLRETLDIVISDGAGPRELELYSGGEAFRANFAIRLALSEILARRAGARLQTLVIDEGFGSQDALGRQRLVEAINLVRQDFAKILVITHIDELKEAFPVRIEVEKTRQGSQVQVV